ncbi:MAG: 50S ribosomal protein L23 [Alphaproteobacteria bacterium]|nr:50S ribosomal protein L23 [Alphaproteobacteria bacterium]
MINQHIYSLIDQIKYPYITKKTVHLLESNQYTFIVDRKIKKPQIKKIIEFLFGVTVIKINTCNLKQKHPRFITNKMGGYKKVVVKLSQKNKINLFV